MDNKKKNAPPRVVLLGRTNVGKSTLFERITEEHALISQERNTTRDTKEALVEWHKKIFTLVDTGGFDVHHADPFKDDITKRIGDAIVSADCVILVTDRQDGLEHAEERWLTHFRKKRVPQIIAWNKNDRPIQRANFPFAAYKGIASYPISAYSGGGTGDLLDGIVSVIGKSNAEIEAPLFKLGLIGRTNVGKSALFNSLCGKEKAIVSPKDHTTREPQSALVPYHGSNIEIIDTAGARKKTMKEIDAQSQEFTLETIANSDVLALVLVAGEHPIPRQDLELAEIVLRERKNLIIIINKWDLFEDRSPRGQLIEEKRIKKTFGFAPFVPIMMTSALEKIKITRILDVAKKSYDERFVQMEDDKLKSITQDMSEHISSVKQLAIDPPRFHAMSKSRSVPTAINDVFSKTIRRYHPFIGTPIITSIAKRNKHHAPRSRAR